MRGDVLRRDWVDVQCRAQHQPSRRGSSPPHSVRVRDTLLRAKRAYRGAAPTYASTSQTEHWVRASTRISDNVKSCGVHGGAASRGMGPRRTGRHDNGVAALRTAAWAVQAWKSNVPPGCARMRERRKGWRALGRDAHPNGDRNGQARSGFPSVASAMARTIPLLRACNRRLSVADYIASH